MTKVKKNAKRQIKNQKKKTISLMSLFHIFHTDSLILIIVLKDKHFLLAQREKNKRSCMLSIDKKKI